ncbi:MAG: pyridoxamine 5'-phosphate oxidase family protein [Mycobacteriaceae bacterium]
MLGELNGQQIENVLHAEVIGRIGCHVDGRTYIVPITYAYDGTSIYGHSAAGLKVKMMRANPSVCFEVEHVDDLANWSSVIAWGSFEELQGDAATSGMQTLLDRLVPLMASASGQPSHGLGPDGVPSGSAQRVAEDHRADTAGKGAVLYRLRLTEKSGRFEAHLSR